MAEETKNRAQSFDPMEPFRGVRDAYMEVWAKSMVDMVNSEAYAQATGTMLDTYLTVSAPFREAVEKAMLKTLEQLAMPSRADFTSLAERMTHIEIGHLLTDPPSAVFPFYDNSIDISAGYERE